MTINRLLSDSNRQGIAIIAPVVKEGGEWARRGAELLWQVVATYPSSTYSPVLYPRPGYRLTERDMLNTWNQWHFIKLDGEVHVDYRSGSWGWFE